jgi:hypothetical protein
MRLYIVSDYGPDDRWDNGRIVLRTFDREAAERAAAECDQPDVYSVQIEDERTRT